MGWPQGQCEHFTRRRAPETLRLPQPEPAAKATASGRPFGAYAETIDATTSIQVFGMPSNAILEMLERQAGAGVPLRGWPCHLGGFTRSPAER